MPARLQAGGLPRRPGGPAAGEEGWVHCRMESTESMESMECGKIRIAKGRVKKKHVFYPHFVDKGGGVLESG